MMSARLVGKWKGAVLPLFLVALWQAGAMQGNSQSDTIAPPSEILISFGQGLLSAAFWRDTLDTLAAGAMGLALGFFLGVMAGVVFGLIRPVGHLLRVTVELLRPLPAIALVPIALLIFGFGYTLEVAIVAFAATFLVLVLTEAAVRQVEPRLTEVARALGLSFRARVTKIVLPAILPRLFVALRLSVGVALIVAITVEIAANPMGLGARLMKASAALRPADMFATLLWIGVLGWGLNAGMLALQKRLFPALQEGAR